MPQIFSDERKSEIRKQLIREGRQMMLEWYKTLYIKEENPLFGVFCVIFVIKSDLL